MELQCEGMEFATEMIIKPSLIGARVAEIPITLHPDGRKAHAPHLRTFRDGWRTLRFFHALFSPRWLFLVPGPVFYPARPARLRRRPPRPAARSRAVRRTYAAFREPEHHRGISIGCLRPAHEDLRDQRAVAAGGSAAHEVGATRLWSAGWFSARSEWPWASGLLGGSDPPVVVGGLWSTGLRHTMRWVIPGGNTNRVGLSNRTCQSFFVSILGMRHRP